MRSGGRVLILLVARNAGRGVADVLARFPREVINDDRYHLLVIDDASDDQTAREASAHIEKAGHGRALVLRNPSRTGYGNNLKIGFRYALDQGFAAVVLLQAHGRHAPEAVPAFVKAWEAGADVVVGCRSPRHGPRWPGRGTLTALQNRLAGTSLPEFHSGHRAYDTGFLRRIPYDLNADGHVFDTEILLQALGLGIPVSWLDIPEEYEGDPRHEPALASAWGALKACLKYRFQRAGFFCSMQYRGLLSHEQRYEDKSALLGSTHRHLLQHIRTPGPRVLDLGCGPGFVAARLTERGAVVTGVDAVAPDNFPGARFVRADFENDELPVDPSDHDYVLLLDVLEHLSNPENLLVRLRYALRGERRPVFLLSTGNVAFIGVRLLLAMGFFTYGERGILDITHKRLFTLSTFRRLLRETGYELLKVRGLGVPFQLVFPNGFGWALGMASYGLALLWPSLFAYQLLVEARPKPHALGLLARAERVSHEEPPL